MNKVQIAFEHLKDNVTLDTIDDLVEVRNALDRFIDPKEASRTGGAYFCPVCGNMIQVPGRSIAVQKNAYCWCCGQLVKLNDE